MTREDRLEAIRHRPEVSVLIVGGGINGVGLLRELALQGVDALLVEKSDFCSGASSASTRVIHGGLRYLENGEFRLVKESLRERNRLLKNAPHYVRPLPTTIPIFNWTDGLFSALGKFLGFRVPPQRPRSLAVQNWIVLVRPLRRRSSGFTHSSVQVSPCFPGLAPSAPPGDRLHGNLLRCLDQLSRTALPWNSFWTRRANVRTRTL